jgi:[ribosomal protein S5]-alanine N-acetyltransferase
MALGRRGKSMRAATKLAVQPAPPMIRTARLLLRGMRPSDAVAVAEGSGDQRVAQFLTDVPTPYPLELATQWIMRRIERGASGRGPTLAITLADDGPYGIALGTVALRIHPRDQRAELGYWLRFDAWNQGYASEATRAITRWGFANGLGKIYARVMSNNQASVRVLQKLGMQQEGYLRSHLRKGKALMDVVEYAVLRQDWTLHEI